MESIVLGGGCFWCLHASYKLIDGVVNVEQGYSGGTLENPTDRQVYDMDTGHAEVVRVTYDTAKITLSDILDIFWTIHDPTTLNRQGPDVGEEYRSIIFYENDEQKNMIEKSIETAKSNWDNPVVTRVEKFEKFYPAADYHKDYETNRPDYCRVIINPKLAKLRQKFAERISS